MLFWINDMPDFADQAVFLDESPITPDTASLAYMESLRAQGVKVLAPAIWKMLTLNGRGDIVPSDYARMHALPVST
ncbi:hypothetical protein ULG90_04830 [Halopseudomonas pachastrellae]|nr:hypothetical protein ULG90_04830 [Halopseudomonas pachastrellae]